MSWRETLRSHQSDDYITYTATRWLKRNTQFMYIHETRQTGVCI